MTGWIAGLLVSGIPALALAAEVELNDQQ